MEPSAEAKRKTRSLTTRILIGMALGVVVGVILNLVPLPDSVQSFLIDGVFGLVGHAFISLLKVVVIPLVFVSLVCGTAALDDVTRLGSVGIKTLGLYLATTAIAITVALVGAVLIRPGVGLELSTELTFEAQEAPSLVEVLMNIFPSNLFAALAEGDMLQIIVFAILFGITLTLSGQRGAHILSIFNDLNHVVLKLVWVIMSLAPYGVFALITGTFATQGFDAIAPLSKYFFLVILILLFHATVTYPVLLATLAQLDPTKFLAKMRQTQIFAFSTASSNATIPITLQTVEQRLGASNSIASFTVPLGATINMDGTAIMQGVATVFISQAYGMGLDLNDYLVVILTATLASIGTAGVPSAGLIMLSMVLTQVGLPSEGIALIIGIDRLLDMVRTAVNVTGDAAVTCIVARWEKAFDMTVFRQSGAEDAPDNDHPASTSSSDS